MLFWIHTVDFGSTMPPLVKSVKNIFPGSHCASLQKDCALIFNCKSVSTADDYSAGSTYFVKPNEKPRAALEELAQKIFLFHTEGMTFDPNHSGAEWWSQVIHPEDDIGIHWDRDYGLEEDMGQHVYPFLGTVTYLSDIGAPTAVFAKAGTDLAIEEIVGSIETVILSCPSVGGHIAFDGSMLHAAPADIYTNREESVEGSDGESEESDVPTLNELLQIVGQKRVTFLVNIWINHIPSQSKRCELKIIKKLKCPVLGELFQFKEATVTFPSADVDPTNLTRSLQLKFNNTETAYDLLIPLPSIEKLETMRKESSVFRLHYVGGANISLVYSDDQPNESSEEDDEEEADSNDDDHDHESIDKAHISNISKTKRPPISSLRQNLSIKKQKNKEG